VCVSFSTSSRFLVAVCILSRSSSPCSVIVVHVLYDHRIVRHTVNVIQCRIRRSVRSRSETFRKRIMLYSLYLSIITKNIADGFYFRKIHFRRVRCTLV